MPKLSQRSLMDVKAAGERQPRLKRQRVDDEINQFMAAVRQEADRNIARRDVTGSSARTSHRDLDLNSMKSFVDPTKETFSVFRNNNRPGPIHMLNLVRFRDVAAYPDERVATGAEAYAEYGRQSFPVFSRLGGRIVWRGRFELMLIGPEKEHWDECFVAEYPSVAAFVEMIRDPDYREAVKHRQAAVLDSRLIRLAPAATGSGFSGAF